MESFRILAMASSKGSTDNLIVEIEALGYTVCAVEADPSKVLSEMRSWGADLLLLPIDSPAEDDPGWQVLGSLPADLGAGGVFVVTTLKRVDDWVRALDLGADDLIHEPFPMEEALARIRAVLRRIRPGVHSLNLRIDDTRKEVRVGERTIPLSPKEYSLLKLLASDPGRVFSSDDILDTLWEKSAYATGQDAQKYIYLLRRKIERNPSKPELILTVRGFGYRLAV